MREIRTSETVERLPKLNMQNCNISEEIEKDMEDMIKWILCEDEATKKEMERKLKGRF